MQVSYSTGKRVSRDADGGQSGFRVSHFTFHVSSLAVFVLCVPCIVIRVSWFMCRALGFRAGVHTMSSVDACARPETRGPAHDTRNNKPETKHAP